MTTLREWFHEFTERTGEVPTDVMLGWIYDYKADQWPPLPEAVIPYASLDPSILDKEFDDGFGGNDSPNLCAWSPSWVIFADNYDGRETIQWVPRHPLTHAPVRPGGG